MVRVACTLACLLSLPLGTAALRRSSTLGPEAEKEKDAMDTFFDDMNISLQVEVPQASLFLKPFRHRLANFWDLQYAGEILVGGQVLRGVLDTGSFDLLVFAKNCFTCGDARAYDPKTSKDARRGQRVRTQHYGSGTCTSVDVKDLVMIGDVMVVEQDMWMAQECEMPLLTSASFHSIVGLGPPGYLARLARKKIWQQRQLEEDYTKSGQQVPYRITDALRHATEDLKESARRMDLLDSLGTRTFSACYGQQAGSPGWIVWNDETREGTRGVSKVKVAGQLTWGVHINGIGLLDKGIDTKIACQDGCGAIVDTGTSLIGVPTSLYNRFTQILGLDANRKSVRCIDMHRFPRLTISMGNHTFSLPPQAYLGQMYGSLSEDAGGFMREVDTTNTTDEDGGGECQLMLMDLGHQTTQLGPLLILGIPFMREFYTTFSLGSGPTDRHLFLSKANDECIPGRAVVEQFRRIEVPPLRVDASKIRVPDYARSREALNI